MLSWRQMSRWTRKFSATCIAHGRQCDWDLKRLLRFCVELTTGSFAASGLKGLLTDIKRRIRYSNFFVIPLLM